MRSAWRRPLPARVRGSVQKSFFGGAAVEGLAGQQRPPEEGAAEIAFSIRHESSFSSRKTHCNSEGLRRCEEGSASVSPAASSSAEAINSESHPICKRKSKGQGTGPSLLAEKSLEAFLQARNLAAYLEFEAQKNAESSHDFCAGGLEARGFSQEGEEFIRSVVAKMQHLKRRRILAKRGMNFFASNPTRPQGASVRFSHKGLKQLQQSPHEGSVVRDGIQNQQFRVCVQSRQTKKEAQVRKKETKEQRRSRKLLPTGVLQELFLGKAAFVEVFSLQVRLQFAGGLAL